MFFWLFRSINLLKVNKFIFPNFQSLLIFTTDINYKKENYWYIKDFFRLNSREKL